jgi:tRNA 2-thiouridine synthesizing protein A
MKVLDVRGLACPEPIVQAKRALVDQGETQVQLLVDSPVTRDSLKKFAASKGYRYAETPSGEGWRIDLSAGEASPSASPAPTVTAKRPPVVLCRHQTFGPASGTLGALLIRAFFKTLLDLETKPAKIIFINEGVDLPCHDEAIIDYCRKLIEQGCEVMSCGTCLDYFKLLDQLQVGRVGNMYDIAGALLDAGHVVEP